MTTPFKPQIVTANDLLNGDVIFLTEANRWSANVADAAIHTTRETAEAALAQAEKQPNRAVGPDLVDLDGMDLDGATGIRPVRLREQIRFTGPTVGPLNTAPRGGRDARYQGSAGPEAA